MLHFVVYIAPTSYKARDLTFLCAMDTFESLVKPTDPFPRKKCIQLHKI